MVILGLGGYVEGFGFFFSGLWGIIVRGIFREVCVLDNFIVILWSRGGEGIE